MTWRDGKDALPKSGKKIVVRHFKRLYIGEYFHGGRYFSCTSGDKFNPIDVDWLDEEPNEEDAVNSILNIQDYLYEYMMSNNLKELRKKRLTDAAKYVFNRIEGKSNK